MHFTVVNLPKQSWWADNYTNKCSVIIKHEIKYTKWNVIITTRSVMKILKFLQNMLCLEGH